ncbi:MAG TPA: ABC transporter permease [Cyclobacteriaceae bacterium]|nr:ABC transporter permease [Cyclobacteriaceae bacterium]
MISNYLRIALRQLLKYRSSVSINIFGLAFGLACCMMCYVHLRYQYSFDTFHENKDRLFRIVTGDPATSQSWVKVSAPIPPKLKDEVPEIESYCRFNSVTFNEKVAIESNGQVFLEPSFMMADPTFFEMFSYKLLKGERSKALQGLNNIVITESIARKLYGDADPVGKVITLKDSKLDFQVTGIMADFPSNTHLRADYLVSYGNLERIFGEGRSQAWGEFNYFAYVQLVPGSSAEAAERKMQAIAVSIPDQEDLTFGELRLQPLTDIHFQHSRGNMKPSYDQKYIYIFIALAISVLVITVMNYFNLATMLSLRRFREIGVRKTIGATAKQISSQFVSENVGVTVISLIIGLLLLEILKPVAGAVLGYDFRIPYGDPLFILLFLLITVFLGIFSGSYLSWFVARFKPGSILKGSSSGTRASGVQHILIFVQFALSLGLITSSFVISRQMQFISDMDLGFDRDHVMTISISRDIPPTKIASLKEELKKLPEVSAVGGSDFTPGRANWHQSVWWEGQTEDQSMFIMAVDQDFIPAMSIEIVEGSTDNLKSESRVTYAINQAAADAIGWQNSVGKMISPFGQEARQPVAVVVKDFNYSSLHNAVEPLVLAIYKERAFSKLSVKLNAGSIANQVDKVKEVYAGIVPGVPFEFTFMDENIAQLYNAEQQMNAIVLLLTVVAVAFALLGIYALISFSIENRTKEIAIRKVLGVSATSLLTLFSRVYLKIAVASTVLAVPVCWVILNRWLQQFTYKIDLNPVWFALALLVVVLSITAIAVAKYLSISQVNPARSLKHE